MLSLDLKTRFGEFFCFCLLVFGRLFCRWFID